MLHNKLDELIQKAEQLKNCSAQEESIKYTELLEFMNQFIEDEDLAKLQAPCHCGSGTSYGSCCIFEHILYYKLLKGLG